MDLALKAVKPLKTYVFDATKEYVSYILSCEDNLVTLRESLNDVCNRKGDIDKKLKNGKDNLKYASKEVASWLKDVRILSDDEELRSIMKRDFEVAKMVVRMMEQRVLKRAAREDLGFQELVVKVMRELKEEMRMCDEDIYRDLVREEYEKVGRVVVDVMKEKVEEFKKVLKQDRKMAMMATRMLKDAELENLVKGDKEMEEIVREVEYLSEEELGDEAENGQGQEESKALLQVTVGKNSVKENAAKLVQPIRNLVTSLGMLMDDANFKKAVPEVESVKLGFDAVHGLFSSSTGLREELRDSVKRHRSRCCCCAVVVSHYHHRYQLSKVAKLKAAHIQDHIISKCPPDENLTISKSAADLKPIPNQFSKAVKSRTALLRLIVDKLKDGNSDDVGIFGMGGTGKTTLAKEVAQRAKDMFDKVVIVEVSNSPNILHIQGEIALSIGLSLLEVDSIAQRAIRLYNQLTSDKEKKTLVILDNIWRKLNLDEVGIPRTCKLLLTTRDREVCRVMGVQDGNIYEVGLLSIKEAKDLFKSQAGDRADVGEYKSVVDRLMSKCGGLPLAIVATANTLKDKDLPNWRKFADELDKPISSQVNGEHRESYLILETSYMFMESEEKRLFFLLACLSPVGSSLSIEELMRYGIGLDLFQHVNKLSEAMEQANAWAEDLVSSSMFLEGDCKGYVKIHDVVRASAILFAAKDEGHKFMVEAIPRWLNKKSIGKYTAISLLSGGDFSRLNGVEADKLQILLLKGNLALDFPDSFFEGMLNLEVLALSKMNFSPGLPVSLGKLKKLRTLHLESCKLEDIRVIGELSSLIVLSLCESVLKRELPSEIGNLSNLSLLDLSRCESMSEWLIPCGLLDRLSQLEGLYALGSSTDWASTRIKKERNEGMVTANELNQLQYLNALEMRVSEAAKLPRNSEFAKNLDMFKIYVDVSGDAHRTADILGYHRVLSINDCSDYDGCLKALLKKLDYLQLKCLRVDNLVPEMDEDGFKELLFLEIKDIYILKALCEGDAPSGMFQKLQKMSLDRVEMLEYLLPLSHVPRNLTHVQLKFCPSLKFFFIDNGNEMLDEVEERDVVIELPFLKSIEISSGFTCQSLLGTKINHGFQSHQAFFNKKIRFPCLELVSVKDCRKISKLWSKEAGFSGFSNLREIKIEGCNEMINVGTSAIFTALVQLESLTIRHCDKMQQVIIAEETEELLENSNQVIIFCHLKTLTIESSSNLECFYNGRYKLQFPSLKSLTLAQLNLMNRFSDLDCSSAAFFSEKMDFPSLEELQVVMSKNHVKRLWDWDISRIEGGNEVIKNYVPMLRNLTTSGTHALKCLPSITYDDLTCLKLHCIENEVLFSSSTNSLAFPELEELWVGQSDSLKELFENESSNVVNVASSGAKIRGQLKALHLFMLPGLNQLPLGQFKGLCRLNLEELPWEYVISADLLIRVQDSVQQLQVLEISKCHKMKVVILDDVEGDDDFVIEFPSLKHIYLDTVSNLGEFCSAKNVLLRLPLLESLTVEECQAFREFSSGQIIAPCLKNLKLRMCSSLECFLSVHPNQTLQLSSLELIRIEHCYYLKSFSSGRVEMPKLSEVHLHECPRMRCFFTSAEDIGLNLPCLETLFMFGCGKMTAFSSGPLTATNLSHLTDDYNKYSLLPFDSLNHFFVQRGLSGKYFALSNRSD
ncbi:uncharacterized protein LOC141613718 [Silene latifolia]|uniref:uncharacterized protein LOC141613718 n=1 Tax=Silene latifolia TaxID=37657 RepID=UPI003D779F54